MSTPEQEGRDIQDLVETYEIATDPAADPATRQLAEDAYNSAVDRLKAEQGFGG